jgi:predicted transcriptional regulator
MPRDEIVQLLEEMDDVDVKPLFNPSTKCYQHQREQPKHRVMVELAAKGYDKKEIATMIGCTPPTIHNVLNHPQMQQTLAETIHKRMGQDDEMVQLVEEGAKIGLRRMLKILKTDDARGSDHISAAKEFLDRKYGKAIQPIVKAELDFNTLSIADIAAQLPQTQETGTSQASAEGRATQFIPAK